jgi:hypothetical protein
VGLVFKAKCKVCQHSWLQAEGGGLAFCRMMCGTCGASERLPRSAPTDVPASMSRSELREYVKGRAQA